jgi:hypothetical protein
MVGTYIGRISEYAQPLRRAGCNVNRIFGKAFRGRPA